MNRILIILFFLVTLFHSPSISSQSDSEKAVRAVIDKLFDGMRLADSSMVSGLFHPDVRMMTSYQNASGEAVVKEGSLETFLSAIGTPHPEVWNEKIWNTEVRIDDTSHRCGRTMLSMLTSGSAIVAWTLFNS